VHNLINEEGVDELRHAARLVARELGLLSDAYFDIGVTLAERHLLIELQTELFPDVGEIAKRLLLDKSTTSRLISKAVKKELARYSTDLNDKRRRLLQLTDKGRQTLHAFEPIAKSQVYNALATLTGQEIETVQKGIKLFAKGLGIARRRKECTLAAISNEDSQALAQLIVKVLKEYGCNKAGFAFEDRELQDLYSTYQQKGYAYFVIKNSSQIIAGAGIAPLTGANNSECELRKMYVDAEHRGLGLGDLLLKKCLEKAVALGYRSCYLETTKSMQHAQKLYLRHGFTKLASRKGNTGHFGCDLFFEKML
jgi:putative acetyltransferase